MYEGFILLALVIAVVLVIRPKKDGKLDQPVVIQRAGAYHATLAPQLVRAQPFLETIVSKFVQSEPAAGDINSQFFAVRDAAGEYLLAAGVRGGIVYFQTILPLLNEVGAESIRKFFGQVMVNLPLGELAGEQKFAQLRTAVQSAANDLKITCLSLL
jgi:regulator of protease activity HflC (stomatin/prohibitin superfamily)